MSGHRRLILAFWLSPLVAPVLLATSGPLLAGEAFPGLGDLAALIVTMSIYALPASYAALLVFGVPTLILLERFGSLNLLSLVACAAVEGFVVMYLFIAALGGSFAFSASLLSFWKYDFPLLLRGSIMAAGIAVAFWCIGGWRVPSNVH